MSARVAGSRVSDCEPEQRGSFLRWFRKARPVRRRMISCSTTSGCSTSSMQSRAISCTMRANASGVRLNAAPTHHACTAEQTHALPSHAAIAQHFPARRSFQHHLRGAWNCGGGFRGCRLFLALPPANFRQPSGLGFCGALDALRILSSAESAEGRANFPRSPFHNNRRPARQPFIFP